MLCAVLCAVVVFPILCSCHWRFSAISHRKSHKHTHICENCISQLSVSTLRNENTQFPAIYRKPFGILIISSFCCCCCCCCCVVHGRYLSLAHCHSPRPIRGLFFFHFIHHWILSEHLFNAHTFCCDRICLFRFEFAFIKFSIRCYDHYNSIFLSLSQRVNNFHFVICTYIRYIYMQYWLIYIFLVWYLFSLISLTSCNVMRANQFVQPSTLIWSICVESIC